MTSLDTPSDPPPRGSRFNRVRVRRGAAPRDAVPRMEHFHVTAAEKRYTVAVEQDRVERRNAAIDDLIKRGNIALTKAAGLQTSLQDKVPTVDDVAAHGVSLKRRRRGGCSQYRGPSDSV